MSNPVFLNLRNVLRSMSLSCGSQSKDANTYMVDSNSKKQDHWFFELNPSVKGSPRKKYYRIGNRSNNHNLAATDDGPVLCVSQQDNDAHYWYVERMAINGVTGYYIWNKATGDLLCVDYFAADSGDKAKHAKYVQDAYQMRFLWKIEIADNNKGEYPEFFTRYLPDQPVFFKMRNALHDRSYISGNYDPNQVGMVIDNRQNESCAWWRFEKQLRDFYDEPGVTYYRIKDQRFAQNLVSGDKAEGFNKIERRPPSERNSELWKVEYKVIDGVGGFYITDKRHNLPMCAGVVNHGKLEHWDFDKNNPASNKRYLWQLLVVDNAGGQYPDFYYTNETVENIVTIEPTKTVTAPDVVGSYLVTNNTNLEQSFKHVVTVKDVVTNTIETSTSISEKFIAEADITVTASFGQVKELPIARASVAVHGGFKYEHLKVTSKGNTHTVSREDVFTFEMPVTAPPKTVVKAMVVMKTEKVQISFKAEKVRTGASGVEIREPFEGKWNGVTYTDVEFKFEETSLVD